MKRTISLVVLLGLFTSACGTSSEDPEGSDASTTSTTVATTTTTIAAATTTATPLLEASEEDAAAITLAYEVVFSSETTYDDKEPYLVDAVGLEETVAKYQETGESMGGVGLAPRMISVDGDSATVIYDLLFGGTPTYPDLTGDAVRVDGTWKVTRDMFCSIMTSARVGCPAS